MKNNIFKRFELIYIFCISIINFLIICYLIPSISFFGCRYFSGSLSLQPQCSPETLHIIQVMANIPENIIFYITFPFQSTPLAFVLYMSFTLFLVFGAYAFTLLAVVDIFMIISKKIKLNVKNILLLISHVILICFASLAFISWAIPELPKATESFIENLTENKDVEKIIEFDDEKFLKENDINDRGELHIFKCEILSQNDYEDNLIAAQTTEDIDIAKQHLKWALEKLAIQGDFLKTIESQSEAWQKELDIITEHFVDITITKINNELLTIERYSTKDQKESIKVISGSMQTGRANIINIFSNINCD